jgi:predicted enzyme related to lactoylglutathione lyase
MATRHGDFLWYELMTSDTAAAERFYGAVLGWRARPAEASPVEYRFFGTGESEIAGLMAVPADAAAAGMRPRWLGYIAVADASTPGSSVPAALSTCHRLTSPASAALPCSRIRRGSPSM